MKPKNVKATSKVNVGKATVMKYTVNPKSVQWKWSCGGLVSDIMDTNLPCHMFVIIQCGKIYSLGVNKSFPTEKAAKLAANAIRLLLKELPHS